MLTADLVIRNGQVVSPDGVFAASVAIKDGVVIAVGRDETMPPASESLDAKGSR
jgi:dihydroorotase